MSWEIYNKESVEFLVSIMVKWTKKDWLRVKFLTRRQREKERSYRKMANLKTK